MTSIQPTLFRQATEDECRAFKKAVFDNKDNERIQQIIKSIGKKIAGIKYAVPKDPKPSEEGMVIMNIVLKHRKGGADANDDDDGMHIPRGIQFYGQVQPYGAVTVNVAEAFFKMPNDHMHCMFGTEAMQNFTQGLRAEWSEVRIKLSGMQARILPMGNMHYAITTKNHSSDDTDHMDMIKEIVAPYVTEALLRKMQDDNIFIAAEVLSRRNRVHGYDYHRDCMAVFCMHQEGDGYYDGCRMDKFCRGYNLPCVPMYIIVDNPVFTLESTLQQLYENRDTLTWSEFLSRAREIASSLDSTMFDILGTFDHSEIIKGDVFEGAVVCGFHRVCKPHELDEDGERIAWADVDNEYEQWKTELVKAVKVKQPAYVFITMGLRPAMKENDFFTQSRADKIAELRKWCVSDASYEVLAKTLKACLVVGSTTPYSDSAHLDVVAEVQAMSPEELEATYLKYHVEVPAKPVRAPVPVMPKDHPAVHVILVCGACGSGKTTISRAMCDYLKDIGRNSELLDGDQHPLNVAGERRQDATMGGIVSIIQAGAVPVVAASAVFLDFSGKDTVLNRFAELFPRSDVHITLFVTRDAAEQAVAELPKDKNLEAAIHKCFLQYRRDPADDQDYIPGCSEYRITVKSQPFFTAHKIMEVTRRNIKPTVINAEKYADKVYVIDHDFRTPFKMFTALQDVLHGVEANKPMEVYTRTIRAWMLNKDEPKLYHMTYVYLGDRPQFISDEERREILSEIPETITGKKRAFQVSIGSAPADKKQVVIVETDFKIPGNPHTHITVDKGPLRPRDSVTLLAAYKDAKAKDPGATKFVFDTEDTGKRVTAVEQGSAKEARFSLAGVSCLY